MGKDHTIFSLIKGIVKFVRKGPKDKTYIDVIPEEEELKKKAGQLENL